MPQYCCVPECKARKGGHSFPKDPALKKQWTFVIKRQMKKIGSIWQPKDHDRVCHQHFLLTDYTAPGLLAERRLLKKGVIPSVFPFIPQKAPRKPPKKRGLSQSMDVCPDMGNEVVIEHEPEATPDPPEDAHTASMEVQCTLLTANSNYSIGKFEDNPVAISYYTGFDCYGHFMFLFSILGPATTQLDYKPVGVTPENQLFITLIKIRQAKEDLEISILFNLSRQVIEKIITTWINFLYFQFKEINFWPSKETVLSNLPHSFKKDFSSTRVILDATEIPIQKPGGVNDQSATFSTYKHKNTLKTMIGCTPRGLVSYVSESYGGSASDRQIIERSTLLSDQSFFQAGDSIMADRGILVQDLFATKDVKVNTPSMLKGKSQLEPEQVVDDRKIASKRIHIERIIGFGKTYKILKKDLQTYKVPFGDRLVFVAYSLSNFRRSIVNRLA